MTTTREKSMLLTGLVGWTLRFYVDWEGKKMKDVREVLDTDGNSIWCIDINDFDLYAPENMHLAKRVIEWGVRHLVFLEQFLFDYGSEMWRRPDGVARCLDEMLAEER